jgi:hypothetical protein
VLRGRRRRRLRSVHSDKPASLYQAFPPAEARRLVERFEWRYTPKHGSWLNMAETELSVLSSQCLDKRIATQQRLTEEVAAWEAARNKHHAKADWQFAPCRDHRPANGYAKGSRSKRRSSSDTG